MTCLPVLKWTEYPCGVNQPTFYDSALVVEDESVHMSCSVCDSCEPNLAECSKDFSFEKAFRSVRTNAKKEKTKKVVVSSTTSTIRDRSLSNIFFITSPL